MRSSLRSCPDAHESGTLNVAGIAGLAAGVRFLSELGVEAVRKHEQRARCAVPGRGFDIPGIVLYRPNDANLQCGVVSFNLAGAVPSEVGLILDQSFEIMARTGLHCAPSAHRTLGTFPEGTVRFSLVGSTRRLKWSGGEGPEEIAEWAAKKHRWPKRHP